MCTLCPIGEYKPQYGNGPCFPCLNKPDNSVYDGRQGQNNANCSYSCATGTLPPSCSSFYYTSFNMVISVFGLLLIVFFILVTLVAVIYKKVTVFRRLSINLLYKRKVLSQEPALDVQMGNYSHIFKHRKFVGKIISRVHVTGTNTVHSPFQLQLKIPSTLFKYILEEKYRTFVKTFNKMARFSKCEKIALFILQWFYPPLYPYFLDKYRMRKIRAIEIISENYENDIWIHVYRFKIKVNISRDLNSCLLEIIGENSLADYEIPSIYMFGFIFSLV